MKEVCKLNECEETRKKREREKERRWKEAKDVARDIVKNFQFTLFLTFIIINYSV